MTPASAVIDDLDTAYRATTYIAHLHTGNLNLRVGHASTALEQLMKDHQCDQWAFISAVNPDSKQLTEAANANRHRQLLEVIRQSKLCYFAGDGVPDIAGWPIEPSLMVLGIPLKQALEIASKFGQRAILAGTRSSLPALYYCQPS